MSAPLFVTGTARSGTNLVARMLDAHPEVSVACDPYFPLFHSLRNAALRAAGLEFDPSLPLEDYYGDAARIARLDAVQAIELSALPFDPSERDSLLEALAARAAVECADLVPHLGEIEGATYRDLLDSAVALVERKRSGRARLSGTKEVWAIEFFGPLARAYPDAHFVVVRRDPRAVVASMCALGRKNASQRAHILSYARHWRKEAAFLDRYAGDPALRDRLAAVTYERLVIEPRAVAAELCQRLDIELDPAMLDAGNFRDADGSAWRRNSSYEDSAPGISADQTERWRSQLDARTLALVELACTPELRLEGYPAPGGRPDLDAILTLLMEEDSAPVSWRSDLGDPRADLDLELARRSTLASHDAVDAQLVRRLFLFPDCFDRLRSHPSTEKRT